jgi:hypothetical protein
VKPKTKKTADTRPIKQLTPRTGDTKYMGDEPMWAEMPVPERRKMAQTWAFCWYNYYFSVKDSKQFALDWMGRNGLDTGSVRAVSQTNDRDFPTTLGWLCRMNLVGWVFDSRDSRYVSENIQRLIAAASNVRQEQPVETAAKPNIQDHLREKMREAGGEIEGLFDDMIAAGCRMSGDFKPIDVLRRYNVAPQMTGTLGDHWRKVADELTEAAAGKDPDLVEGYRGRNKIHLRNMIRFAEQVVADCASYVQIKKVERKPRKKKPVSPEKLTARFKYLREFAELGLKSVSVTSLVNAQEAWFYDTKRRKLIYVTHESISGSFSVKGSSLIGFDPTASVRKTLRKPKEQIKALLAAGAPAARKLFKDIRSTETKFNGRGNEHMILLKVR